MSNYTDMILARREAAPIAGAWFAIQHETDTALGLNGRSLAYRFGFKEGWQGRDEPMSHGDQDLPGEQAERVAGWLAGLAARKGAGIGPRDEA